MGEMLCGVMIMLLCGIFRKTEIRIRITSYNVCYTKLLRIAGSRDAIRFAFSSNLISNGDLWMDMIRSRIQTSHTYNEETANEIYLKIISEYFEAFKLFEEVMEEKLTDI